MTAILTEAKSNFIMTNRTWTWDKSGPNYTRSKYQTPGAHPDTIASNYAKVAKHSTLNQKKKNPNYW